MSIKPIPLIIAVAACLAVAAGFMTFDAGIFKSSVMGFLTFCFVYFTIVCFSYKPEESE